jgi:hypothetical protein
MSEFPWGVVILLSCGLAFTGYVIYYILRLAYLEMKDETSESDSINHKSHH